MEESAIRTACEDEAFDLGLTLTLQTYGDDFYGFLLNVTQDHAVAADLYSLFAERLWRALPHFRWESSVRTWAFVLLRRQLADHYRATPNAPATETPSQIAECVAHAVERTLPWCRQSVKARFDNLLRRLAAEDRLLIALRVSQRLSWKEIAQELGTETDQITQEAARLRQRYKRLKAKLKRWSEEDALFSP